MTQITMEQLKPYLFTNGKIKSWKLRECSMCNAPLSYLIKDGIVAFDSSCDCSSYRSAPQDSSPEDLLRAFNIQTSDEVRERMWKEFTTAVGLEASNVVDDMTLFARAREVANLHPGEAIAGYGPSDVGDTLVRYVKGQMKFADAMTMLDGLAIDYQRHKDRTN